MHRTFWPLITVGSLLEAASAATVALAVLHRPHPAAHYHAFGYKQLFGYVVSVDWQADSWNFAVAAALAIVGLVFYLVARRAR